MKQASPLHEIRARRGAGVRAMRALDRDARTPLLLDAPAPAADALSGMRSQRVIVVGCGSIGSHYADLLSRATVASLLLVDRASIKPESVLTHPVHPRDIGRPKATLAGERAKAVSPSTRVQVYDGSVEDLPLDAFVDASAVLLASDNLACEREISQRCSHLAIPLIQASVHGATLVAQVRSLANQGSGPGPCLACDYQTADWEALDRGTIFSCAGGPALRNGIPTVSPAQLCSTAASLAVTELLGRSTGLVSPSASRLIEYCGFNHHTTVTALVRRDACPADHEPWSVVQWQRPLASASPRELFAAAGCPVFPGSEALASVSLTVEGFRFSRMGACACPDHPLIARFRARGAAASACLGCGSPLEAHPFYTHEVVPGTVLSAHLDCPLVELGADAPSTALVRLPHKALLFHSKKPLRPQVSR